MIKLLNYLISGKLQKNQLDFKAILINKKTFIRYFSKTLQHLRTKKKQPSFLDSTLFLQPQSEIILKNIILQQLCIYIQSITESLINFLIECWCEYAHNAHTNTLAFILTLFYSARGRRIFSSGSLSPRQSIRTHGSAQRQSFIYPPLCE